MKPILIGAALCFAATLPAHAYLDPGTGSMVLQAIVGTIAVAGASISIYWNKVRDKFSSRQRPKKTP